MKKRRPDAASDRALHGGKCNLRVTHPPHRVNFRSLDPDAWAVLDVTRDTQAKLGVYQGRLVATRAWSRLEPSWSREDLATTADCFFPGAYRRALAGSLTTQELLVLGEWYLSLSAWAKGVA